ncbi:SPASM domain-containing protein [Streptomyces sp. NPDC054765]
MTVEAFVPSPWEHEEHATLIPFTSLAKSALRPAGQFHDWAQRVGDGAVQCSKCWLLPVCGGHCPKRWSDGEIACPSMKANLPQRLSLGARRMGLQPTGRSVGFSIPQSTMEL